MSQILAKKNGLVPSQARAFFRNEKSDLAFVFTLAVLVRLPFLYYTADDAYITFRYARNLAQGLGFVYNAGEAVLGTTTPLYTLVLALFSRAGVDLILAGKLLNIFADAGTCVLIYLIARALASRGLAWAAAGLVIISPYNVQYAASGMETGIYTFLCLLVIWFYAHNRWIWLGITGGILTLVRPDGLLLLFAIALAWLIEHKPLGRALQAGLVVVAVQLPWLVFATLYFGSPIPNSIAAKAESYRALSMLDWGMGFVQIFLQRAGIVGGILVLGFAAVGIASIWFRPTRRSYLVLPLWFVIYLLAFTLARSGRFAWYYAPLMPTLYLFVCLGGYELFARVFQYPRLALARTRMPQRVLTVTLILVVLLGVAVSLFGIWDRTQEEAGFETKIGLPIAHYMREHTPSSAMIALESIGAVGWYSERHVLDEGGLVSHQIKELNGRNGGEIDSVAILKQFTPEYYVAWEGWELDAVTKRDRAWFEQTYRQVEQYSDGIQTWILFERINPRIASD